MQSHVRNIQYATARLSLVLSLSLAAALSRFRSVARGHFRVAAENARMNRKSNSSSLVGRLTLILLLCLLTGCPPADRAVAPHEVSPAARGVVRGTPAERWGDEIVACGRTFHTGTRVVLWTDPGGYDAYRVENRFENPRIAATQPAAGASASRPAKSDAARYGSWRKHVPAEAWDAAWRDGWTLESLREHVDLFVMHYDACSTSERCFQVLHDVRHLSVHFMIDVDGTVYQTLDLKERAWHAGHANDRSIGVEIANIGAYAPHRTEEAGPPPPLDKWYAVGNDGYARLALPPSKLSADHRVLTPGFVGMAARPGLIDGSIHGEQMVQYDFTAEQYAALIRLTAAVCRVFPRITTDCPRDAAGSPRWDVLTPAEFERFSGLVGHYHLTREKTDPGPAFNWERVVAGVKREMR